MTKTMAMGMFALAGLWWALAGYGAEPAAGTAAPPTTGPAKELTLDLGNKVTMKLVLIPVGKFMMGVPPDEPDPQVGRGTPPPPKPQHEEIISKPFYMSIYDVTQEQYEQVMGKNPSKFRGPQNPVDTMSWYTATEFCETLSKKLGIDAHLASMPQWEYACRAGSTTRLFYGKDPTFEHLGEYAWYIDNSDRTTHPVGQKKPNAWGLYDMYGNVWQWCDEPEKKGTKEDRSTMRPIRGGGWMNEAWLLSSARIAGDPRTTSADHLGIRVVVEVPADQTGSK